MKKVAVIGHFAFGKEFLDGQTVKTKIVTEELARQLGSENVRSIDTYGGKKTLLKAPFQVFCALKNSDNVLIFPARNGLRVYAPLLSVCRHLFKGRKLHYVVIGGWLPQFLPQRKQLTRILKGFDGIHVETATMQKALEAQGFENIHIMPNCKKLTTLQEDELIVPDGTPYKLCTFSRVMKEKGIGTAAQVVKAVNEKLGYTAYTLDIYGKVDENQTQWFEELQNIFPDYVRYGGLVPFDQSVEVLKSYFALLFPTYYDGEGFAGTLIDAFSAGVPVIASDWKYNPELVNENVGYVYPTQDHGALAAILEQAANDPAQLLAKKVNCLKEAQKYQIDQVVGQLIARMDEG